MRKRRKEKLTRRQRRIKNRVKLRTLFFLAVTLIFNSYAWFLYLHTVSADLTAHVDAWQVQFKVDNEVVDREFVFNVDHAYPGMTEASKTVSITNAGERTADIGYKIKSFRIFDEKYQSSESITDGVIPENTTVLPEIELLTKIQTEYPFVLSFTKSSESLEQSQEGSLKVALNWQYDSGNDTLDTDYGTRSYTYYETNPDAKAMEVVIVITAEQHNETDGE